jgi:hypothetical protein
MSITVTTSGDWSATERWLAKMKSNQIFAVLERYGPMGAAALAAATPTDSGATANAWTYKIENRPGYFSIKWLNTNKPGGFPVAVMLQYGHGTGTGGYVQGRDYINPVILPMFEQMMADLVREVNSL